MDDRERRLRHELRGRAWQALAAVPADLDVELPLEEAAGDAASEYEVVLTVRKRGAPPAPPAPAGKVVSLAPVQGFLEGCWLTDLERAVIACIMESGRRLVMPELRPLVEARLSRVVGEGPLKAALARMADPCVGILSSRKARPPGYAVTIAYRGFLSWVELVRRERHDRAEAV